MPVSAQPGGRAPRCAWLSRTPGSDTRIVPWVAALSSADERLGHARQLLASTYGDAVSDWEVRLSEAPPGSPRVACTFRGVAARVRELCARHRSNCLSSTTARGGIRQLASPAARPRAPGLSRVDEGTLAAARIGPDGLGSGSQRADWLRLDARAQTLADLRTARQRESGRGPGVCRCARGPGAKWPAPRPRIFTGWRTMPAPLTDPAPTRAGAEARGMKAPVVRLDFAARTRRTHAPGRATVVRGVGARRGALLEYHAVETRKAGLELRLAASARTQRPIPRPTRDAHV